MASRVSRSDPRLPELTLPAVELAPLLLGCLLVRREGSEDGVQHRRAGVIVETEAYPGGEDRASHTFGGRRTVRVASMWRRGGRAYVYFTYGMHHCVNVVSGPEGSGEAVLIRAIEPCEGWARMLEARNGRRNRPPPAEPGWLCGGPARLCTALAIDRRLDGVDLADPRSELGLEPPRRVWVGPRRLAAGPRIGVAYAGAWATRPWRFWIRGSPFVSRGG